ncbi:hypothetical protein QNA08_04150 [Chelatococcus sp. SYSU_G07232]|uniref:Uncharacterized protein n=1 Tax=Chelatococcus albus TaxID=3047466 RepID=A0ABT7ADH5_9HYPH|nr:hypothetical protein [Chelatococcus sp. SYSU_G07232]MDJ1157430.1 hypothetical protein [Chelatococcus sp. SYSU_G07232]
MGTVVVLNTAVGQQRARAGRPDTKAAQGVRDEPLAIPQPQCSSVVLHAWRGRSGRRYVVSVYPLAEATEAAHADAVLIAVRRDADGRRHILGLRESGALCSGGYDTSWFGLMRGLGAEELHVHLLATAAEERAAVLADLRPA